MLESFKRNLAVHLSCMPEFSHLAREEMARQIETGIEWAARFGIRTERDVSRYIELALRYFGGFLGPLHPKAALNILYAHGVEPQVKLDRLEVWGEAANWRSAAAR